MKFILITSFIILTFVDTAYSYPENQMSDYIASALNNPATQTIPKTEITNYCDCALKLVIDENKDIRDSGYKCALENFN